MCAAFFAFRTCSAGAEAAYAPNSGWGLSPWPPCRARMGSMPHYLISREPLPAGGLPVPCQDTWMGGCSNFATWRVGCGPDVRFFCDSHEGPPCGGVFVGDFSIAPETTREELLQVVKCGAHRIHSLSGRDVHELWCCACGEWMGDIQDSEIAHVSIPLDAECQQKRTPGTGEVQCRACEEMFADALSASPLEDS